MEEIARFLLALIGKTFNDRLSYLFLLQKNINISFQRETGEVIDQWYSNIKLLIYFIKNTIYIIS